MGQAGIPKVSVAIAFLNGDDFLAEAVDSVMAQTLADWELVLVDDGSTDGSGAWAEDLAARDPRVRCLAFPGRANRGQAAARVLAAEAARGEYLLFLDHDDVLLPHCLARLAAALDAHRAAAIAWGGVRYWPWKMEGPAVGTGVPFRRLAGRTLPGRLLVWDLLNSDARHPANCSTMIRRAGWVAAARSGSAWPGMYEETAMLLRVLLRGRVHLVGEVLSAYRLHAGSFSHRAAAAGTFDAQQGGADRVRFLRWARAELPLDPVARAILALALRRAR